MRSKEWPLLLKNMINGRPVNTGHKTPVRDSPQMRTRPPTCADSLSSSFAEEGFIFFIITIKMCM